MENQDSFPSSFSEDHERYQKSLGPSISEEIQALFAPYQIIRKISQGGMGEVFLAYDKNCRRYIALKSIRIDLKEVKGIYKRFLHEATLTAQLMHPSIVPIYSIHQNKDILFYTMPYIKGKTLKEILRELRVQEKNNPSYFRKDLLIRLIHIFLKVCQAIAYAHSNQVVHRDIKPENFMVGEYGEVIILDWGLAITTQSLTQSPHTKLIGTVSYMAPELASGARYSFQTDIYALGATFYQILTLTLPFHRKSIHTFKEDLEREEYIDPIQVAPYRDIPQELSNIVQKCLKANPKDRYISVDALIHDLTNFIEGKSQWYLTQILDKNSKSDWEFHENVLFTSQIAITRKVEIAEWYSVMISKTYFSHNTKLEFSIQFNAHCQGFGVLIGVPEKNIRTKIGYGYSLVFRPHTENPIILLRHDVEVLSIADCLLEDNVTYAISLEKKENNLCITINGKTYSYLSHVPISGNQVGLMYKDLNFTLSPLQVFSSSMSLTVSCLAIPDCFLSYKDYPNALSEYRKISLSFPGRHEGREALFRAGITLIEEAKNREPSHQQDMIYSLALEEFSELHNTPSAPLEYLGKSLVYEAMNQSQEELNCLELAIRRYPTHPELHILKEHILYRMYATSKQDRKTAYGYILLVTEHLPKLYAKKSSQILIENMKTHWEEPYFLEKIGPSTKIKERIVFIMTLGFWLTKPYSILAAFDEAVTSQELCLPLLGNAFFSLLELKAFSFIQTLLDKAQDLPIFSEEKKKNYLLSLHSIYTIALDIASPCLVDWMEKAPKKLKLEEIRILIYLFKQCLESKSCSFAPVIASRLRQAYINKKYRPIVDQLLISYYLYSHEYSTIESILNTYSKKDLKNEHHPLFFVYGCWLLATHKKTKAHDHFHSINTSVSFTNWSIGAHYLAKKNLSEHLDKTHLFDWELQSLHRQLALYYYCDNNLLLYDEHQKRISPHYYAP